MVAAGLRALARIPNVRLQAADPPPALPTDGNTSAARSLALGESASLDELGPVVVTESGQLRYIDNWADMSEGEREATQRIIARRNAARLKKLRGGATAGLQRGSYLSGGFTCGYLRKPASAGFEGKPPLLLVHPVGVGLSSWFWEPFLAEWRGSEVFVPDLIGCGSSEAWQPAERGLFVPLDWVRALEALWREEIRRPTVVLAQGALAPLAVQLATRETDTWRGGRAVRGVVLASPPPWAEAAVGLPEAEARRNFALLSATLGSASPLGTLGYRALCARPAVRFFARRFLFAAADGGGDAAAAERLERFVDACCAEAAPERRWPVLAFNAGLVGQRALGAELRALRTPTLVLAGAAGGLAPLSDDGGEYAANLPNCRAVQLAGRNALPWESARATAEAVGGFVDRVSGVGLSWG